MFEVATGALRSLVWTLVAATGHEAVSELYAFTLVVLAHDDHLTEQADLDLLEQGVRFTLGEVEVRRAGMVTAARFEGLVEHEGHTRARFRLEVAPRAALLHHRRNSRIFQGRFVHEIVSTLLTENDVPHRYDLGNSYVRRIYCTQYEETDYDFCTRLFAEEGIFFYFEHPEGGGPHGGGGHDEGAADPLGTAAQVMKGVGTAAGLARGLAGSSDTASGVLGAIGGMASATGDAIAGFKPERHEHPVVPGAGAGSASAHGREVLVFTDQATGYRTLRDARDEHLLLHVADDASLAVTEDYLSVLSPRRSVRPEGVEVRDYDFRRPLLLLSAKAEHQGEGAPLQAAMAHATGAHGAGHGSSGHGSGTGGAAPDHGGGDHGGGGAHGGEGAFEQLPKQVYAHHGELEKPDVDPEMAQLHLEQHRADALLASGRSHCPHLLAGHTFRVDGHAHAPINQGAFAVTRVYHDYYNPAYERPALEASSEALMVGCARAIHESLARGQRPTPEELRELIRDAMAHQPESWRPYMNRFDCVPADRAFRPPRPRRVMRNVTESATVVGPTGSDIHVDDFGRIKVQFHWDREGAFNEDSSCWIRVAQTWAGAGYGFQFLPRVGMEVLVTFLGGDPDRPVVLGTLYNGTHVTPEPLPKRRTRSALRTQTSPGGGGFHELAFEDQKGHERIYLRSERNLEVDVKKDQTVTVSGDNQAMVSGKQEAFVGGDERLSVGKSSTLMVGQNLTDYVQGNRSSRVVRNATALVEGNTLDEVGGVSVKNVLTDELTMVHGSRDLTVYGDCITHVGGKSAEAQNSHVTYVQGNHFTTATRCIVLKAETADGEGGAGIRLECGDSVLELTPSGIVLQAGSITVRASDRLHLEGHENVITLLEDEIMGAADEVSFQSAGALLHLGTGEAGLDAPHILLRADDVDFVGQSEVASDAGSTSDEEGEQVHLKLQLTHLHADHGGEPIDNTRFRVVAGLVTREGDTGGSGEIDVEIPASAKVAQVTVWANETYPDIYRRDEGPLRWTIHLVEETPAATDPKGVRYRLRNLGYTPGGKVAETEREAPATEAEAEPEAHGEPSHPPAGEAAPGGAGGGGHAPSGPAPPAPAPGGHPPGDGHGGFAPPALDAATRQALLEFQLDHDLSATGELDDTTKDALEETYGS